MSNPLRADVDLKPVLHKLGHTLEEIRVRALHNILSKLEHGLICEADLIQQQHLHIQLLEWFNHDQCQCKQEVLQLIKRLAKHCSSVKQFLEIGAVDFLSKLRADSEDCLHAVIDDILESLLSLPSQDHPIQTRECVYQHYPVLQEEPASVMLEMREPVHAVRSGLPEPTIQHGYFPRTTVNASSAQHANGPSSAANSGVGCVKGLKFSTFPWLPLTPTDRHVLTSTHSSLCSPRPSMVLTSCEFVSDVVLQDFPAEIFLQRPCIAKSLISLVGLKPLSVGDHSIPLRAIKCLRELSTLLLSRHKFYHDPALYCPKQDFGSRTTSSASIGTGRASCSTGQSTLSSDSRPSVIGRNEPRVRGDGRDGDSPSSVGSSPLVPDLSASGSDTDSEDAIILQFSQLTLPQFATDVLVHVTPLLKSGSTELVVAGAYLLSEAVRLMSVAVTTEIWDDSSAAGRALTDKLSDSFETLGEVVHYHYHECHGDDDDVLSSPTVSHEAIVHHRLSMIAIVALVDRLTQDLVPLKKAKDILPESLSLSLYLAAMDQGLMYCIPDVRPSLLNIVEICVPSKHRLYHKTARICDSLDSACRFLQGIDKKNASSEDLLNLAEASLRGLHYHRVLSLADMLVQLCSDICCSSAENDELIGRSRKILLKFLAYPEPDVQSRTYAACLKIVKDVIRVDEAIRPRLDATGRIHFLLDAHILYEICCFGLGGAEEKVCSQAVNLMLHLVQGKLLMGCTTWDVFLQACIPVLPLLQAITEQKSQLSNCIMGLLQPCTSRADSGEYKVLSHLEKLRGSLRLLLCRERSVRLEGAKGVLYYLSQETARSSKLPSMETYTLTDLADLLLMDHAISLDSQDNGRSVFQVDGLLQVFSIFTAASTEAGLRKSALEQIAVILQDASLHKAFLSQGGLDKVLDCMLEVTMATTDGSSQKMLPLVPACLCILRHILHQDSSLRHQLAHQDYIYYLLIRGALLCYTDSRVRYHTAHVMVLLLFDEVASLDGNQAVNQFSLPKCVSQKYKLPFRCPTIKSHSSHRIEPSPTDDPLTKSPVAMRMLKIVWNVAWHGGIQAILGKIQSGALGESHTCFSANLALNKEDILLLRCSHTATSLNQCLQSVQEAASHYAVKSDKRPDCFYCFAAALSSARYNPPNKPCSHTATSLNQCLQSVQEAASHYAVKVGLWRLSLWLLTDMLMRGRTGTINPDITECMLQLEHKAALGRFLEVFPANVDDETLLAEVLAFIMLLIKSLSPYPSYTNFLHWLGNVACGPKSTLIGLLGKSKPEDKVVERRGNQRQGEVGASASRSLHKQLVAFFGSYVQSLPISTEAWRRKTGYLGGSLTHGLLLSLNSADATHFYDLPSLENTLHSLVHVTARPGWSLDWSDGDSLSLCQHLLNSLLEVVSAFHVGRGGTAMSYMGKGVTKSATVCLCHLAHEMAVRAPHKNWTTEWLYTRQRQEGLAEIGLGWLIPLWSYRDPEVRAAGFGIATALSSFEAGRVTMTTGCQHLPGGLWAVTLGVLLDQSECSIVRHQATLLLVNLLSQHLPNDATKEETWTGPLVHDQHTQLSVSGLPALHALIDHYNMYQGIASSLCHFYGQASIQPVSIVEDSTVVSSSLASGLSTATTPDIDSSGSNSGTTSPETVVQPTLMNGLQPQMFSSPAESGQQSSALLLGTSSSRSSSSLSRSSTVMTSPNTTGRYISVVTPCLVSALCHLLRNLLALSPKETVALIDKESIAVALIRLVDIGCISSLLHRLALSPSLEHSTTHVQLYGHLAMCRDIMRFFQANKQAQDPSKRTASADDTAVYVLGCRLLGLSCTEASGSCSWKHIHEVWESVLSLMLARITVLGHVGLQDLMSVIINHWTLITGAILHILKSPMASSTRIVALNFLASLMGEIHRQRSKETDKQKEGQSAKRDVRDDIMLDLVRVIDEQEKEAGCEARTGSLLCSVLLQAYDGTLSRSLDGHGSTDEKTSIVCALRNLLAVSHQAKTTAIKSGLIESIVDSMQHTHAKLNIECLQHPRPTAKKKEEPLLVQLVSQMGLLQNCLCNSQDAKMSSHEAGLTSVLLRLWSWSILDNRLLAATLSLLTAYTANCATACSSLVQCPPGQSGSSLLHRIVQQVDREKGRVSGHSREDQQLSNALFAILSNAVLSSAECRNALWKSGFLQTFTQECPQRKRTSNRRSSTGRQLSTALWLHLLANLTFSPEGQQMVMRIPEALELLLVFGESTNNDVEYLATVTLHNLCFLGANKPKLLTSDKLLAFFEKKLACGMKSLQYIAVNAVWALLYGSQKAKAILKSATIFQSLIDAQNKLQVIHLQPLTSSNKGQGGLDNGLYQALSSVMALMID